MQNQRHRPLFEPRESATHHTPLDIAHRGELRISAELRRVGGEIALQKSGGIGAVETQGAEVVEQDHAAAGAAIPV